MAPSRLIFRGEVFQPVRSSYSTLILPFVLLKKLLQALHRFVVELMWSELVEGKTADQFLTLIGLLIFCLLSLLAYYARGVGGLFLLGFGLLWLIDYQLAKGQFMAARRGLLTSLEQHGDWLVWQRQTVNAEIEHAKFPAVEVAQISLLRTQVQGGAFQAVLGTVWQVYLTLYNQTELLVHESHTPIDAFQQAKQLSADFAVPLIVLGSEGIGQYAAAPIALQNLPQRTPFHTAIRCQKSAQKWHIYSQWQHSSSRRLLREIVEKFSFLLFVVIITNGMIQLGGLLHFLGSAWFSAPLDPSFSLFVLHPTWRWQTLLELGVALGVMIFQGAQLSREEHLYVCSEQLTFYWGNRKIAEVDPATIEAALLMRQPFPSLLILTSTKAFEIHGLQNELEFRLMLSYLSQALTHLDPEHH